LRCQTLHPALANKSKPLLYDGSREGRNKKKDPFPTKNKHSYVELSNLEAPFFREGA
jgi:hypothetical protein